MQQLIKINKCAHVHHCIKKKVCYFKTPEKGGYKCLFFDKIINQFKEVKVSKEDKKLTKLKTQHEKKLYGLERKFKKLQEKKEKTIEKYNLKVKKVEEKIAKQQKLETK